MPGCPATHLRSGPPLPDPTHYPHILPFHCSHANNQFNTPKRVHIEDCKEMRATFSRLHCAGSCRWHWRCHCRCRCRQKQSNSDKARMADTSRAHLSTSASFWGLKKVGQEHGARGVPDNLAGWQLCACFALWQRIKHSYAQSGADLGGGSLRPTGRPMQSSCGDWCTYKPPSATPPCSTFLLSETLTKPTSPQNDTIEQQTKWWLCAAYLASMQAWALPTGFTWPGCPRPPDSQSASELRH